MRLALVRTAAWIAAVFLFAPPAAPQEAGRGRAAPQAGESTKPERTDTTGGDRAVAGRSKALACQACHGLDGLAKQPDAPHLAGQPAIYLERALRAYRSGERRNEVMAVVAKPLNDDDIRDLAAYFASLQIEVKSRP